MRAFNKTKGFTLIELLLVIVIIGLMLAVIVPRAWRANIDTKYGLVRMNCSELASFGMEWAEKSLLAQDEVPPLGTFSPTLDDYIATLIGQPAGGTAGAKWVADTSANINWNNSSTTYLTPTGRTVGGTSKAPEDCVEQIVPPDKIPRNPFNGVSVFEQPNFPQLTPITGAIACGGVNETPISAGWHYYAFVFQGTDNTTAAVNLGTSFHAGQETYTLPGLRNGIFFARLR